MKNKNKIILKPWGKYVILEKSKTIGSKNYLCAKERN